MLEEWNILAEAERVHAANSKWWHDLETGEPLDLNKGERLMLVVTELAEAMEGHRKSLHDDKLSQFLMEEVEIADALIRVLDARWGYGFRGPFRQTPIFIPELESPNVGEALLALTRQVVILSIALRSGESRTIEQAFDYLICAIFTYVEFRGFDSRFREIYEAKMAFNAKRYDHSREARLAVGGKKI